MTLSRLENQELKYETALKNPSSPKYTHFVDIVRDAIDRMLMQSDVRDIYHGVHVVGLSDAANPNKKSSTNIENGIDAEFYLQLSDKSKNETQLLEMFKHYLSENNYSLGGTNLYSSQNLLEQLRVVGKI